MIDDEDHPEMQRALKQLAEHLQRHFVGKRVSTQLMTDLNNLIAEHRAIWRKKGVDFPALAALVVPRVHAVSLMRADLDNAAIAIRIVKFVKDFPAIRPDEVAQAVVWAFPDYRPDDTLMKRMRETMAAKTLN